VIRRWRGALPAVVAALAHLSEAQAAACPAALAEAERLIVVTTGTMTDTAATLTRYERSADGGWRRSAAASPVVVGSTGVAWAWSFAHVATPGEPRKLEGDNRTPAGIFRIGQPFGLAASPLPGYLQLRPAATFCVDDPSSPFYNRIVDRTTAGPATRGEDMATIEFYRRGLTVDYPTNAETQGGSCIFLHVWKGPGQGTSGCVAGEEPLIEVLQSWASARPTAIAILPLTAQQRFSSCLPASDAASPAN
jgi:L,D-peptidoglycan transpeptidase YkuD (ErfK/YbiS/YcfS/YnhG family)